MDELAKRWLDHDTIHFHHVAGSGKSQVSFDCVAIDKATDYAAEDADVTLRLWNALKAAARRRARRHRLRDAGAGDAVRAGAHGAARHFHRPPGALTAVRRIRAEARRAGGRDQASSPASRSTPARPSSSATFCSAKWACPAAPRPRPGNGRPARANWKTSPNRATRCRARSLDWRQVSKLRSTYTEALPTYVNPTHAPRAHLLRACRHLDRPAVVVRAELAEHPDPHRGRPQNKARLRRRSGHEARLRRLFADRAAALVRSRRGADAAPGLQGRRRHPRHDRVGNVRRAGQGHADARYAAAPRRSTSASSTASRPSASPRSSASTRTRPAPTSRNISSASPASATTWTRRASSAAPTATCSRCSAASVTIRTSRRRTRRSVHSTSAPPSTRVCRARPPTSSAAP